MVMSFVLSFFPRGVLDEILNLIESVSEGFSSYSYLDIVNVRKFRTALTKLRTSSHRLEIEEGRWARPQSIARENRKCKFYNKLEDDFFYY